MDSSKQSGLFEAARPGNEGPRRRNRRLLASLSLLGIVVAVLAGVAVWLAAKASTINDELNAAAQLSSPLRESISRDDREAATGTVDEMRGHTAAAKSAADDPLWTLASAIPAIGVNFSAVAEVARSADDVVSIGLTPLVKVYSSLDWDSLLPSTSGTDLEPLKAASPSVSSAAHAVRLSSERLNQIDESQLLPQVANPLSRARNQLNEISGSLDSAASAAAVLPAMLGAEDPRSYLLMIQNNAESRASGGIPGALAVLQFDDGKLTLGSQSSASALGTMSPPLPVDGEQQQIYSVRLGKFMQDVNLTPDFPSAAKTAREMWNKGTGQNVDGVLSIDPIALGYILDATGPVGIADPELTAVIAATGLPAELTGRNVVQTLLSDVYAKIERPELQDAYFAGVAQEVFRALSNGKGDAKALLSGLTRASTEGRVHIWSAQNEEQGVISAYTLSGSVAGPSVQPAQFGVYFNDGTGAKMDYYVKRTVQIVKECPQDGYERTTVRVSATNAAPQNAAAVLPDYVTGGGAFGVPPGSVQTNIVVYGPVQANVETLSVDGTRTEFAPHIHSNRPVAVFAVRLGVGESKTMDFTFSKIVQHTEPNVVVTPTVQDVKDVTLPTLRARCS
ncbi:hypothetical protein QFZ36_001578 [Pseudarthrobacter siccitolerans]|uniref:DUF4012 domain-containing protein n=1 Tax=Pseudarthrobacter siccitolerans TaxID=861266 RepID=A0ABU0PJZ1_9MICC|nr:DUF4012 domain-containing protein [Pseudarthrobacter siccitolerans]MDQ0674017.1 hypothetical protein [Pseudarthrobacter siccitolerans]